MEKIKIKKTMEQLGVLLQLAKLEVPFRCVTGAHKAEQSILIGVFQKLRKKALAKELEPTDKPFTLSFLYHEAFYLEKICREHRRFYNPVSYEAHTLRRTADELNQKLCV
ncbi:hypothetical protein N8Z33_00965 [Flavobacteriaceae bacterium]|nr:hypothetical protein [Flavobacteriaceae bacterium]